MDLPNIFCDNASKLSRHRATAVSQPASCVSVRRLSQYAAHPAAFAPGE